MAFRPNSIFMKLDSQTFNRGLESPWLDYNTLEQKKIEVPLICLSHWKEKVKKKKGYYIDLHLFSLLFLRSYFEASPYFATFKPVLSRSFEHNEHSMSTSKNDRRVLWDVLQYINDEIHQHLGCVASDLNLKLNWQGWDSPTLVFNLVNLDTVGFML